jgi:hypothetical protein
LNPERDPKLELELYWYTDIKAQEVPLFLLPIRRYDSDWSRRDGETFSPPQTVIEREKVSNAMPGRGRRKPDSAYARPPITGRMAQEALLQELIEIPATHLSSLFERGRRVN